MRSDDIRRLKEQQAVEIAEVRKLVETAEAEDRSLTAEETEEYEKRQAEIAELSKRRKNAEQVYMQEREIERVLRTSVELKVGDGEEVAKTLDEYRQARAGVKPWDLPEVRAATWKYLSVGNLAELDVEEQRALSKATGAAGANLVPTAFANEIINIIRFTGPFNELASVMTTASGEAIQIPSVTSHGVATWTAENAGYTASDEVFGQVTLNAFKIGRTVIVSEELLTDAQFGLSGYLSQEFGDSIGVAEETAYAVGDGTGKPLGVAHASSGVTVSQAAVGNATSITYAALLAWVYALPYQYRRNAVWVLSDSAVRQLYAMVDGQQRPLWNVNVATQGPDTFLGYPVYTSPDLAAVAASAKVGVFGDISRGYRIRRVDGFSMQRQNELYSNNGQIGFRGFERVDGRVVLADAMRVLQLSAT
jgi:HK97 family phage major capsid protein